MIAPLEHNATLAASGRFATWQFFIGGVDFIRQYADDFHHAKVEDALFEALVANGMSHEHGPVAVMLQEHDQGRHFVKRMEDALTRIQAGEPGYLVVLRDAAAVDDQADHYRRLVERWEQQMVNAL